MFSQYRRVTSEGDFEGRRVPLASSSCQTWRTSKIDRDLRGRDGGMDGGIAVLHVLVGSCHCAAVVK